MNSANSIRTIRMLVENHHGAQQKIADVFTTRAYSISALNVMQGEEMRQITVAVRCNENQFALLREQLISIADVVEVISGIEDVMLPDKGAAMANLYNPKWWAK